LIDEYLTGNVNRRGDQLGGVLLEGWFVGTCEKLTTQLATGFEYLLTGTDREGKWVDPCSTHIVIWRNLQ